MKDVFQKYHDAFARLEQATSDLRRAEQDVSNAERLLRELPDNKFPVIWRNKEQTVLVHREAGVTVFTGMSEV